MPCCGFHEKNTNILNDERYKTVVLGAQIMFKYMHYAYVQQTFTDI